MRFSVLIAILIGFASPALAAPTRIVADTPVTASLVRQVAGDLAEIPVLLPAGSDPHSYQLRPSDARALQQADLLIWVGPVLTPWLDRAAESLSAESRNLELAALPGVQTRGYGNDGNDGKTDPHLWLAPDNAGLWLAAIAEALASHDAGNASRYRSNARSAQQRIAALDRQIAAELAPLSGKAFVVFHDAYGYFTRHYGLSPALAVTLGDASDPSAARLRDIRNQIAATNAICAFSEYGQDPRRIGTVIDGTNARIAGEFDLLGRTMPQGPDLYSDILKGMADNLIGCLGKS
ncbi:MAG: zinc ABC transporter substrate-binding protein [Paracoccus sp. (in: a-proteobacteria)]|uniref:zinc ABC transporter substrate-binding protein n=1 Tax=Paracoccus sp. TaxID=267 RepID=UPI0030037085